MLATLLLLAPVLPPGPHGSVRIHEFLAVNDGGLLDEDGDDSDWIEILNDSGVALDLGSWHLTDDPSILTKWTLPSVVVPDGGYLIVFASGKDRAVPGAELHTNFKLSGAGEFLALVRPNGINLASAYNPTFPPQTTNVSYGLRDSFLDEGYFSPPTPAAPNGDLFAALALPEFSAEHGLHDSAFALTLSHPEPGAEIRYTLDGSEPSVAGTLFTGPIQVDRTRIVRAYATKANFVDSAVATASYVFPDHVLQQSHAGAIADGFPADWVETDGTNWDKGGSRPGAWYGFDQVVLGMYTTQELKDALAALPTVSLVLPPEDWFGNGFIGEVPGIYCNSEQPSDRKGSLEWIDPSGGPKLQVDCGIAIQGGSSTGETLRNQLSIALKFREEFGPKKLEFPVFEDSPVDRFDYLVLDAGNQNAPNGVGNYSTKKHAQGLRDQFMSDFQRALCGLAPRGRFVHVYLNGLYWGVYDLHERIDHRGASAHLGGEAEEYDYVKEGVVRFGNSKKWNDANTPGAWSTALEIAKNGLKPGDTWQGQPAYEAFQEWFDVADYVDYLLVNYFGGNTDWPQNNWMGTSHSRLSADWGDVNPDNPGWRWHSWDAETVLWWGGVEKTIGDGFYDRTGVTSTWSGSIVYFYTYLRENPEWRILFADKALRHFRHGALYVDPDFDDEGTPYDPAHPERNRPATVYHRLASELEPAIMMEYARWGNYWHTPGFITPVEWRDERDRLLEDYFAIRSGVLRAQLENVQPQLLPDLDAPEFTPWGGSLVGNEALSMTVPAGATAYYTTDGSDPRLPGGAVNPAAQIYSGPFQPPGPTTLVQARAYDGSEWSALESAGFLVGVRLAINEVQARNQSTVLDENGQAEDWVELKNLGPTAVDLTGWGLSDDPARPGKWRFPAGTQVPPKGYLLVWCDDDEFDGPLHATFKLSGQGESVVLTGPAEVADVLVDRMDFGPMKADRSVGRIPDGTGKPMGLVEPSPLGRNRLAGRSYQ